MTETRKYFNTDGIRGRVGTGYITPGFMMKLGWAVGKVLGEEAGGTVLIGKDTRLSGYMLESALEAGLSAAGMNIGLLGPLPTPVVAYVTKRSQARAGIVITASHNPYHDNGIKIFSRDGRKLSDAIEMRLEEETASGFDVVTAAQLGKAHRVTDAAEQYMDFCKERIRCDLSGLSMVIDCANGAAYRIAPTLFRELGASVEALGVMPDGVNINRGCGAASPRQLRDAVLAKGADVGLAFDGDGDRLIMVDHEGNLADGDEMLCILAREQKEKLNGGVVGTQMSNAGLERSLREMDLDFYRAQVGDRYVTELLHEKKLFLGGEQSGHIVNRHFADTGDGIVSALQVLSAMRRNGVGLRELKNGMKKYPQTLHNIKLRGPVNIKEYPGIARLVKDVEEQLDEPGRVLLRPSGTEPLLRVMVEGGNASQVKTMAEQLARSIEQIIG